VGSATSPGPTWCVPSVERMEYRRSGTSDGLRLLTCHGMGARGTIMRAWADSRTALTAM